MAAFEAIRKPRTTFAAKAGFLSQKMSCLPDGPEQEARDHMFRNPPPAPPAPEGMADVPKSNTTPPKLEDYDPPKTPSPTFTPEARKYNMEYDILDHVSYYVNPAVTRGPCR